GQPGLVGSLDRGDADVVRDVVRDVDLVPRSVDKLDLLRLLTRGADVGVLVAVAAAALLRLLVGHARRANRPRSVDEHVRLVGLREVTRSAEETGKAGEGDVDVLRVAAAEGEGWGGEGGRSGVADVPIARARARPRLGGIEAGEATTRRARGDADTADVDGRRARGSQRVLVVVLVGIA